jgi:hypothetical protein
MLLAGEPPLIAGSIRHSADLVILYNAWQLQKEKRPRSEDQGRAIYRGQINVFYRMAIAAEPMEPTNLSTDASITSKNGLG